MNDGKTSRILGTAFLLVAAAGFLCDVSALGGPTAPPPVTHLCLAPAGSGQIQVAFAASPTATSYNIYWGTTPGVTKTNGTKITGVTSGSALPGFADGTLYYIVATAVSSGGESAESLELSVTPNSSGTNPFASPTAPLNPVATPGDHSNVLTWTPVTGATGYSVYSQTTSPVVTAGLGASRLAATSSPYSNTPLTPGTLYYYVINAVNPSCEGPDSVEFSGRASANPTAPVNVNPFAADSEVIVSWTNSVYATSHNLYWGNNAAMTPGTATKIAGVSNPYTHTSLTNGQSYCYIVTGVNSMTESAPSSPAVCATPNSNPPATPAGFTAVATDQTIVLSWHNTSGATSYRFFWSNIPGVTPLTGTPVDVTGTSYPFTGLTNQIHYYFVLMALNNTIPGNPTGQICATPNSSTTANPPPPTTAAPAPVLVQLQPSAATAGDPSFTLSIVGNNFVSGASVLLNGSPFTATWISATHLQGNVPASALTQAGTVSVQVQNPDLQKSGALTFTVAPFPVIRGFPNLSAVMKLTDVLQVDAVGVTDFAWSLTETAPAAAQAHAAGSGTPPSFTIATKSNQLAFSNLPVSPGSYHLTLVGTNLAGKQSAPANADFALVSASLNQVRVYPNPWRSDTARDQTVKIDNLTPDAAVKIFTLSGRLIKEVPNAGGKATWDLTDDSGHRVSSGIYFYLATDGAGNKSRGKVAVIK